MAPSSRVFQSTLGVFVMLIVGCAVLGLGLSYGFVQLRQPSLDAQSCPINGPTSLSVIYLDAPGQFDTTQGVEIRKGIGRLLDGLSTGETLHLYYPRGTAKSVLEPVFDGCKPPDRAIAWFQNADAIKKKYMQEFREPVLQLVDRGLRLPIQQQSPILEALVDIGAQSFRMSVPDQRRRLFVISDLIQNDDRLSHLKGIPSEETFRRGAEFMSLRPRLPDVSVCLVYLTRAAPSTVQGMRHIEFWRTVINLSGARLGSCEPVSQPDVVVLRL